MAEKKASERVVNLSLYRVQRTALTASGARAQVVRRAVVRAQVREVGPATARRVGLF